MPAVRDTIRKLHVTERDASGHTASVAGQDAGTVRRDVDPDAEATVFLGVMRGVTMQWLLDPKVDLVGTLTQYGADARPTFRSEVMDIVIRGGTVIDGTGAPARTADVAINDGVIVEVGQVDGDRRTGDRRRRRHSVTPGFVDIHTHYDGQAVWDERLQPSSLARRDHGRDEATAASASRRCDADDRDRLVELMEGVEDIPGTAIHEGLSWEWESFPEYLDALERRPHDIDFAAQVPHGALRLYVMGDRGGRGEDATPDEIAEMGRLAAEAVDAGALGFTTSRTRNHRTVKGEPTPTLKAPREELVGIAAGARRSSARACCRWCRTSSTSTTSSAPCGPWPRSPGRPISISLAQNMVFPDQWQLLLDGLAEGNATGCAMRGQVAPRPVGLLLGLQASMNPFLGNPAYMEIASLPLDERVDGACARKTGVTAVLVAAAEGHNGIFGFERIFVLGDPPDYEPKAENSIAAYAERAGVSPAGDGLRPDARRRRPGAAVHAVPQLRRRQPRRRARDARPSRHRARPRRRRRSRRHDLRRSVRHHAVDAVGPRPRRRASSNCPISCSSTAATPRETVGLFDRGVLAPGYRADVNVIDFDGLRLSPPEIHHDLPAGGRRLLQPVTGYKHTIVGGVETYRDGVATGALPGD